MSQQNPSDTSNQSPAAISIDDLFDLQDQTNIARIQDKQHTQDFIEMIDDISESPLEADNIAENLPASQEVVTPEVPQLATTPEVLPTTPQE